MPHCSRNGIFFCGVICNKCPAVCLCKTCKISLFFRENITGKSRKPDRLFFGMTCCPVCSIAGTYRRSSCTVGCRKRYRTLGSAGSRRPIFFKRNDLHTGMDGFKLNLFCKFFCLCLERRKQFSPRPNLCFEQGKLFLQALSFGMHRRKPHIR